MTMTKIIALTALVLLALSGALLEGFIASIPQQFIQLNGILIILCTAVFVLSSLKILFVDAEV